MEARLLTPGPRAAYRSAKELRERGDNRASLEISGLWLDRLSEFWYEFAEEFGICAYYDPKRRDRGLEICEALVLDRDAPADIRMRARYNLCWYTPVVDCLLPSWTSRRLSYEPPEEFQQLNPSIARFGNRLLIAARTSNYRYTRGTPGYELVSGQATNSRTFLLELDPDSLEDHLICEICLPPDWPEPIFKDTLGFEDARLFEWNGEPWIISMVKERSEKGLCEQMLARVQSTGVLADCKIIKSPFGNRHEKNWMPCVRENGEHLTFIYSCDPLCILSSSGDIAFESSNLPFAADGLCGGSQLIPYANGYLAVVHFKLIINSFIQNRQRFIWFDESLVPRRISRAFTLPPSSDAPDFVTGIQFVAGLCWHPDGERLIISYSTEDSSSWVGTFLADNLDSLWFEI